MRGARSGRSTTVSGASSCRRRSICETPVRPSEESRSMQRRICGTQHRPVGRQRGATLVVGLVLLLVLTVLGVSGMNMATLEITMSSNSQFQQDAFQAAETGIDVPIAQRN